MSVLPHANKSARPPSQSGKVPDFSLQGFSSQSGGGADPMLTRKAQEWLSGSGCVPLPAGLEVLWNGRLRTTAGTACVRTMRVELNPRLVEMGLEQISRTLRHELAHLLAHIRAGRRAARIQTHGAEWRQACADLGIGGEPAFHDLPFERRSLARKYSYQCPNCGLIAHRVRKFERCTACFQCCKKFNRGVYHPKFQFHRIYPAATGAVPRGRRD